MQKLLSLMLALLSFGTQLAAAQPLSERFELNEKAAIWLPPEWEQVSQSYLQKIAQAGRALGARIRAGSDLAFQRSGHEPLALPYIAVNIRKSGRIAAADVDELLSTISAELAGVDIKKLEDDTAGMVKNTQIREIMFDEENSTVVLQMLAQLPGHSSVMAESVIYFVKDGYVQVIFYADAADFSGQQSFFERVAHGVTIDPDYTYNPIGASKISAFFSGLSFKVQLGLVLLILALLGKIVEFCFKNRSSRTRSRTYVTATPVRRAAPADRQESEALAPGISAPLLSADPDLLKELCGILEKCPAVMLAELYHRAQTGSAQDLVLAVQVADSLPLKEQQELMRRLQTLIPPGRVTNIIPYGSLPQYGISGMGAVVFNSRTKKIAPIETTCPKTVAKEEDDSELKLELDL